MNNHGQSVRSQGQDQERGRRRGEDRNQRDVVQESHVSIDKLYCALFFWCRALGLHAVIRNKQGDYVVSGLSLAPAIVMSSSVMVCLGFVLRTLTTSLPFWFSVVLFSTACGYGYCLYSIAQTCWNAGRMRRYMAAFSSVKVHKDAWGTRAVAGAVLYPLLVSVNVYALLPEWTWACPNIFITSAVPALLDAYLTCFSRALKEALKDLGLEVRRRDSWRPKDVSGVSRRWVALTELLQEHNEIFRPTLLLRLLVVVVQAMALLFVLWATNYVRLDCCIPVFSVTFLPLLELKLRLYLLCFSGEDLARAAEGVVAAVRAAAYTQPAASPQQLDLSALAARLEAHPTRLRIWGMDSLSMSTFVSILGIILTYFLVLIQFCTSDSRNWVDGDQNGSFSRLDVCFPPLPLDNSTAAATSRAVWTKASPPLPSYSVLANLWRRRKIELEV